MQNRVLENFKNLSLRTDTCILVSWSSMIVDDEDFPQGQQLSLGTLPLFLEPIVLRDMT